MKIIKVILHYVWIYVKVTPFKIYQQINYEVKKQKYSLLYLFKSVYSLLVVETNKFKFIME